MLDFERHWYRTSKNGFAFFLLPFSWLFGLAVFFRRFLYRRQIKKTQRFSVPVIVVGNITVGGTGKTPFVIWLVKFLKEQGFRPGIVSRGVGGKQQKWPRWVDKNSDVANVGDEAVLLLQRAECPVVIGMDRVAAVRELLNHSNCNVVISDDGLQHYRLVRDIEIAMIDGMRGLGNHCFLPAGPLRESSNRLREVDFVVEHFPANVIGRQGGAYKTYLFGNQLVSIENSQKTLLLTAASKQPVHAVAGIGNPQRFFVSLRNAGLEIFEHRFPDHYRYRASDFDFGDGRMIVMTEKDAVKCREFADERFWCLPVEMEVEGQLGEKILERLKTSCRLAPTTCSRGCPRDPVN